MIKVSDYLAKRVAELGIHDVFLVTGGGAMHLNDSFGAREDLRLVCNHHEQACAIALDGYARIAGHPGCAVVTTGPGGTNTITGVMGMYQDSVPGIVISGQVRYDFTVDWAKKEHGIELRQMGDQETDIVSIVTPITKYAVMVTDPATVRYHFEKAVHLATTGRPGPVWLDVPLNVQAARVEESELEGYVPEPGVGFDAAKADRQAADVAELLHGSERPVVLAGTGIRASGAHGEFLRLAERMGIPVVAAWNATDTMPADHPLYMGMTSNTGQRGANFVIQNADVVLSIGCRLNVRQTGYEYRAFARAAKLVAVDIDVEELKKPTIAHALAIPVHADAGHFIGALSRELDRRALPERSDWVAWCAERKCRYPAVLPEMRERTGYADAYVACDVLSDVLGESEIVVQANGSACIVGSQVMRLKAGSRMIENSGTASMGWDLPAAIGACVANERRPVVCLSGDGSIMMNLQELETIAFLGLPVKIVLLNNGGYLSIRQTQDNLFDGHRVGEAPATGVGIPDFAKVAAAFGIPHNRVSDNAGLQAGLREALEMEGPFLCEVMTPPDQVFMPKNQAEKLPDGSIVSKPIEDMWPFLDRDEFAQNMIVAPYEP